MTITDTLLTYLPMDRCQALTWGVPLPDHPYGAVLLADISGFTPLTEALLTAYGPRRGVEELTQRVNRVYDVLIAEVDRYHGSVIGFSGDAITCWFADPEEPPPGGAPPTAALQAVACALAMQRAMDQVAAVAIPQGQPITLAIKIAVAAGSARRFLVGDPAVQLLEVLAGGLLERMARGEGLAAAGEVLLDPLAEAALGAALTVTAWRMHPATGMRYAVVAALAAPIPPQPWPPLPTARPAPVVLRRWLPPGLYARLETDNSPFLTELRPTVALMIHFAGIDYDGDPAASTQLAAFVRWVQAVIVRYEGTLLELIIGDKGSYLYSVFGALLAHEDDARRAVVAARALSQVPARLAPVTAVRIGISQGTMRTGPTGGTTSRRYGVLGGEVNLAARLMEHAAPGQVLVSRRVQLLTAHAFHWEALPAIAVKGFSAPVPVYTPVGVAPPAAAPTLLVGRRSERRTMRRHLDRLQQGTSGVVLLEGEPGIGKSQLIAYLQRHAARHAITTWTGAGDAVEQLTPYYAWRALFAQALGLGTPADLTAGQHLLQRHLADTPDLLPLGPLLNPVLPFTLPETEQTRLLTGSARAQQTLHLLLTLLRQCLAGAPAGIILEDAHWLDSASWALALAVSRDLAPVLLVLATRPLPAPLPPEYGMLRQAATTDHIVLPPLPSRDALALVCARLGCTALPPAVAALILEKAEGHPLFSEELAYALRDSGLITIAAGECRVVPGADLHGGAFSTTLQGVIINRIDRLSPAQQVTLKVASVIGRLFAYQVLRDIHPLHRAADLLAADLLVLGHLDFAHLVQHEPDLAYLFKHIIIQETTYNLMVAPQRQSLHRAVAEWYEQRHAADLAPLYPLLAYHWRQALADGANAAALVSKAVGYTEQAAHQAARNNAHPEAVRLFQDALALLDQLPATPERHQQELALQLTLGGSLTITHGIGAAAIKATYDRAWTVAQQIPETVQLLVTLGGLVRFYMARGDLATATDLAVAWCDRVEHSGLAAQLGGSHYLGLGQVLYRRGDLPAARTALEQALAQYDATQHQTLAFMYGRDVGVEAHVTLGITLWYLGYLDQAVYHHDAAVALARGLQHPISLALALGSQAALYLCRREPLVALEWIEAGLTLAQEAAAPQLMSGALMFQGWALVQQNEGRAGLALLLQALTLYESTGARLNAPMTGGLTAQAFGVLQQIAEGLATVDRALGIAAQTGEALWVAELHRVRGDLLLAQTPPDVPAAEAAFQQARHSAQGQAAKAWELRAAISLSRLWQQQGRRAAAYAVLAAIHSWFTEGADNPDLRDAAALLIALR